jgi:hypothetical protein
MTRRLLTISAAALVIYGTFVYYAIATLCDEDYWPDW